MWAETRLFLPSMVSFHAKQSYFNVISAAIRRKFRRRSLKLHNSKHFLNCSVNSIMNPILQPCCCYCTPYSKKVAVNSVLQGCQWNRPSQQLIKMIYSYFYRNMLRPIWWSSSGESYKLFKEATTTTNLYDLPEDGYQIGRNMLQ
jgi:hypothetical protein